MRKEISMDKETLEKVEQLAEDNSVSVSELLHLASTYIIDNNIDIFEGSRKFKEDLENVTYNLKARLIRRFGTLREASEQLGVRYHTLLMYCSGKFKPSKAIVSKLVKVLD